MANSILSSLLGSTMFSIKNQKTSIFVATSLKIKDVDIKFTSEPMRHQLEDGSTKIDTRIIKASSISASVYIPNISTLEEFQLMFSDRIALYTITSRGIVLADMRIDTDQMSQPPTVLSATPTKIAFKQQLIEGVNPVITSNAANSSVIDRGISLFNESTQTVSSIYSKVSSYF